MTYNEYANQVLYLVNAKAQIQVLLRELCKVQRGLLLEEGPFEELLLGTY